MTRVIAILSILALAARDSGRHPRVPARFRAFFIASPFIFRSLNSYPPATPRQSRIIPHGFHPIRSHLSGAWQHPRETARRVG